MPPLDGQSHVVAPSAEQYLFAVLHDETEVFGTRAFPFVRDSMRAAAFTVGAERRVLTEAQCRVLKILHPETVAVLPTEDLWQRANHDPVIRTAVKERCGF